MNTIGSEFCFTSFGESHGVAIGGVVDGLPAGMRVDMEWIKRELQRRSGKGAKGTSPRAIKERDEVEWLSGLLDGVTLGTPLAFLIRNTDAHPEDYEWMKTHLRSGHADFTYLAKYGLRDWRGGGRASARETAARVVAGTLARQQLQQRGITIQAFLSQVGEKKEKEQFDPYLAEVQREGDSIGGIVTCLIQGLPTGIGEPLFDKLQAHLAFAMMSINGCKGFDYGAGFDGVGKRGSELYTIDEVPSPSSGGIEGGISNGLEITFRCVFKPAATLRQLYGGRHDACIAVRAVPVVEAMTAMVIMDMIIVSEKTQEENTLKKTR